MKKSIVKSDDGKVYLGHTGKFYHITSEDTVRKVGSIEDAFVENLDDVPLPEEIEAQNTKILHKFLQRHLDEVTYKRGYVYYKGFRLCYASHGFEIKDNLNYGEIQNVNKYHNDFPTPEDVLTFLQTNADRGVRPPAATLESAMILSQGENLRVKVTVPKNTIIELPKKVEISKADRIKSLKKLCVKFEKDKIDHYTFRAETMTLTNRNIRFKTDKLFNKFRKRSIRYKGFKEKLFELFQDMDVIVQKDVKPKRQPKFKGLELDEVFNWVIRGNVISFDIEGPSQQRLKRVRQSEALHLFRCKEILSQLPQAMPYIMRVADGRLLAEDIDEEHYYCEYAKDIYQAYDEKVIRDSKFVEELHKACDDFIYYNGLETILHRKTLKGLDVGDFIEIAMFREGKYEPVAATVLSTDAGIKYVNDWDGSIGYLMKWQYVMDTQIKKFRGEF